jgi:hypothetical protein
VGANRCHKSGKHARESKAHPGFSYGKLCVGLGIVVRLEAYNTDTYLNFDNGHVVDLESSEVDGILSIEQTGRFLMAHDMSYEAVNLHWKDCRC